MVRFVLGCYCCCVGALFMCSIDTTLQDVCSVPLLREAFFFASREGD